MVPDADEAVATGAALQAAAIGSGRSSAALAARWSLGSGETIEPTSGTTGVEIREAYAAEATRVAG